MQDLERQVGQWLDTAPRGWDYDKVPRWLEAGRRLGPGIVPVLAEMWAQPLPAFRSRGVRTALHAFVEKSESPYYPYYWVEHTPVSSAAAIASLPGDTRAIRIRPSGTGANVDRYAAALAALPQLESICIDGGSPALAAQLRAVPGLLNLEVTGLKPGRLDLAALADLGGLRYLRLGKAPFESVEALGRLEALRSLTLEASPSDLGFVESFKHLDFLKLVFYPGEDLHSVGFSGSLACLKLEQCPRLETLAGPAASLSALQAASFAFNKKLSDLSALAAAQGLTSLLLSNLPQVRDARWLARLSNLDDLGIQKCTRLEDVSVVGRLTGLTRLGLVDMGTVPSLAFLGTLQHLLHLDLVGTRIGDRSYEPLYALKKLLTLDAWMLKESDIRDLREALPYCVFNGMEAYIRDPGGAPGS